MSIPSDNPILLAREFGPDALTLAVGEGEIVALPGACDEGFLRALSGADPAWPGGLWLKGEPLHTLRPAARLRFAHAQCAVAPRVGKLLPELTVLENTALPLILTGLGRQEARRRALRWLERLDAAACAEWRIAELTPAEMRRVALARALVLDPAVLLAEDPTEGLSAAERFQLLRILRAACGTHRLTIVVASDDEDVARWADRQIALKVTAKVAAAAAGPVEKAEPAEPIEPIEAADADEPLAGSGAMINHQARGLPHRIGRHARGEHRFSPVGSGAERGR
ncbi:ATP-binding cassette domain-containing protein [Catenulispora sp. GP43]|uniref:ATP-binding cassette domain-containing protein n=1 Tax=Catenulispora sp. GP43 TaxID=3156263 RepID=UPI003519B8BF